MFTLGADPVKLGLVTSLNRPGGNMTGVTQFTTSLEPKRFELLREAVPNTNIVGMIVNPNRPGADVQVREVEAGARAVGQQVIIVKASNDGEIDMAFETLAQQRANALLVASDAFFFSQRQRFVTLAARYSIPTIYQWREYVALGGLMSYGTNLGHAYRQVGIYTARVLKGENPSDLPVQQVVSEELAINLKTANALGLTFPLSLLGRADEVIE